MIGKCGRAVEGVGLENQSGESHRGFESLRFLQRGISSSGRASALHAEGDRFDSDILHQRGCSSVVERLVYTQDVVGSIPTVPTKSECSAVWLAHLLWEQGVVGSNPTAPTILVPSSRG